MKLLNSDCLEVMKSMADNIVDLTVTSPPYDNLRTYNGYTFDFKNIAKELFRITKQGGVLVWIVADETKNFCETLTSFKQAIFFNNIGFNLLDTMIYLKNKYAPAYPTIKRYANQFEFMFILTKEKPKTFNPKQDKKIEHRNSWSTFTQKNGSKKRKFVVSQKETKNASNVWIYNMEQDNKGHPAIFPLQLAIDHIKSWSNENDIVLDCFMGSGTTGVACKMLNRDFIGIEISKEYFDIATTRINNVVVQSELF